MHFTFKVPVCIFLVVLVFQGVSFAEDPTFIVAVASKGSKSTGQVSFAAGRAGYFLLFDEKGKLQESLPNPYSDVESDAGPRSAELLASKGVELLIAGRIGWKMSRALDEVGVEYVEKQGEILDVIKEELEAR